MITADIFCSSENDGFTQVITHKGSSKQKKPLGELDWLDWLVMCKPDWLQYIYVHVLSIRSTLLCAWVIFFFFYRIHVPVDLILFAFVVVFLFFEREKPFDMCVDALKLNFSSGCFMSLLHCKTPPSRSLSRLTLLPLSSTTAGPLLTLNICSM